MNLIMFCYNFLRTKNILGFEKMLEAIKSWTPDYSKVVGALKKALIKMSYGQNERCLLLSANRLLFLKAIWISRNTIQLKLYRLFYKRKIVFSQSDGQGLLLCWYSLNVL